MLASGRLAAAVEGLAELDHLGERTLHGMSRPDPRLTGAGSRCRSISSSGLTDHDLVVGGPGRRRSNSDRASMIDFMTLTRLITRLVFCGEERRPAASSSSWRRSLTSVLSNSAILSDALG